MAKTQSKQVTTAVLLAAGTGSRLQALTNDAPKCLTEIPKTALVALTPYYVLMDGHKRIGPKVIKLQSGIECSLIYGFSDKRLYDTFCVNSERTLIPYPLVKNYLQNQAVEVGNGLKLIVIDADAPSTPCVHAATMEAVLDAQEQRATHVNAAYRLIFDQAADAYSLEAVPVGP